MRVEGTRADARDRYLIMSIHGFAAHFSRAEHSRLEIVRQDEQDVLDLHPVDRRIVDAGAIGPQYVVRCGLS